MKIDVTGDALSTDAREKVVRRVLLTMSRFGPRLAKVTVRLATPANPLGGVDRRCRMRAWTEAGSDIRSEVLDGTVQAAVDRATSQLAKRVARALNAPHR